MNRIELLRDLLTELNKREGCRVDGVAGMAGPRGPIRRRRLLRTTTERKYVVDIPNMNDEDPVTPPVGRAICVGLGLKPDDYGF